MTGNCTVVRLDFSLSAGSPPSLTSATSELLFRDPQYAPGHAQRYRGAGVAALPVSIGVAILQYRLYDIDRIISMTLAYALVTAFWSGCTRGLVLLATQVLRFTDSVAVAASTLAAALFNPVRQRVQRAVDRRFHRSRYDAGLTVTAFAARLKDAVDLDSGCGDLTGVMTQALEPVHVSVWIDRHG